MIIDKFSKYYVLPYNVLYADLTLSDEIIYTHLRWDNGIFYSESVIDKNTLEEKSKNITILIIPENKEFQPSTETHDNYVLDIYELLPEGGCRFSFRSFTEEEKKYQKLQSDIDFIMMMTGIEE